MSAEKLANEVLQEISSLNHSEDPEVLYEDIYKEEKVDDVSILSTFSKQSKRALQEESNLLMKELYKTMLEVRSELTDVNSKVVQVTTKVNQIEEKQKEDKNELTTSIAKNTLDPMSVLLATELIANDSNRTSSKFNDRKKKKENKVSDKKSNPDSDDSLASDLDYSSASETSLDLNAINAKTRRLTKSMYLMKKNLNNQDSRNC